MPNGHSVIHMKLGEWLKKKHITQQDFATRIGKSQTAVSKYVNGKMMPDVETVKRIRDETKGRVGLNDWGIDESEEGRSEEDAGRFLAALSMAA